MKQTKMKKFVSDLFPGWSSDDNYGFSPLGKLWIIWHPSLLVSVIYKSLQMIMAEVTWPSCQSKFFISIIYASNDVVERVSLWEEIASLAATYDLDTKPWILLGDFNQIRDPVEHSSPPSLNMDKRIRDFNNCLINESLDDLNFRDTTFTWRNKQKSTPVAKKLDRCLVNGDWYAASPSSVALFGSPDFSDHAVMSVGLDPSRVRTKKPFRFYNFLNQNPDFLAMVCVNWFSFNVTGSAMFRLSFKHKMLKNCIRTFSHQNYSGIERKTAEAHAKLLLAQSAMLSAPNPLNASVELQAMKEWEELSSAEAAFFFQRAHINWITLGDGNSRLFHRYAASRQAHNHIHYLLRILVKRLILRRVLKTCALVISLTFLAVQYLSPCLSKVTLIYSLILNNLRSRLISFRQASLQRISDMLSSLYPRIKWEDRMVTRLNSSLLLGQ